MKSLLPAVLGCLLLGLSGCGKPPNRSMTDGVDLEAIRAYEEMVNAVNQHDASVDWRAQGIAEEKEAAEIRKKAAAEAGKATP